MVGFPRVGWRRGRTMACTGDECWSPQEGSFDLAFLEAEDERLPDITNMWEEGDLEGNLKQIRKVSLSTLCAVVKRASLKRNRPVTTHRVHWSPAKLSRATRKVIGFPKWMFPAADDIHMFMQCPRIAPFWTSVCNLFSEVIRHQLIFFRLHPEAGLRVSSPITKFVLYMILLLWREICRLWKSANPPLIAGCLNSKSHKPGRYC